MPAVDGPRHPHVTTKGAPCQTSSARSGPSASRSSRRSRSSPRSSTSSAASCCSACRATPRRRRASARVGAGRPRDHVDPVRRVHADRLLRPAARQFGHRASPRRSCRPSRSPSSIWIGIAQPSTLPTEIVSALVALAILLLWSGEAHALLQGPRARRAHELTQGPTGPRRPRALRPSPGRRARRPIRPTRLENQATFGL